MVRESKLGVAIAADTLPVNANTIKEREKIVIANILVGR
jgi:hypothetical protein